MIGTDRCGHCSVCTSGRVAIPQTVKRQPLSAFGFREVTDEFVRKAGPLSSVPNVTKFLCGVSSPALTKLNAKRLSHFGVLDRYPFLEVRRWVSDSLKTRSR